MQLRYILVKNRGMESLKHNLNMERESHASTREKYVVLLAKANRLEGKAIEKRQKLSKAKDEPNDISRNFEELREA